MLEKMKLKSYTLARLLPEKQKFRTIARVQAYSIQECYRNLAKGLGPEKLDEYMDDPNVKLFYETSYDAYKEWRQWVKIN